MKKQRKNLRQNHLLLTHHSLAILSCFIAFFACSVIVCANAPSNMTIAYNLETQELRVTITHPVSNPSTHYIFNVEIQKNGMMYNTSTYTSQPDPTSFTYIYQVNASAGDSLSVTATCIQGGSKTAQQTISTNDNQNNTSTPGFEIMIMLVALAIIIRIMQRKNN
jgi:hypothetical protein